MKRLRCWLGVLLVWLLVFFNIERFHEPLNLASFVYVLAALSAVVVILLRRSATLPFAALVAASLAVLLIMKAALGYAIVGGSLPITVTEACSILITLGLSRQIALGIEEFENSARDVMRMRFDTSEAPLRESQADLYREVRRARTFDRPLTLFALSASNANDPAIIARHLEEVQSRSIRRYMDSKLAELLKASTSDCDIVAYGEDHFLVLCPECTPEQARDMMAQLTGAAQEQMGLELKIGSASFPDEEVTLGGLVEKAAEPLRRDEGVDLAAYSDANDFEDPRSAEFSA